MAQRRPRKTEATEPFAGTRPVLVQSRDNSSDAGTETDSSPTSFEAAGSGGVILKALPFTITMPPPDDYYFVREDQLEGLTEASKDYSLEIALFAGGGAIGLLQNIFAAFNALADHKAPPASDTFLALVAVILVVLAVTKLSQWSNTEKTSETLKKKIQSGQKAVVSHAKDNTRAT
jgi:hypothetical protein